MEPSEDILTRPLPEGGIRIQWGEHPSQFGELRLPQDPSGPVPTVVVFHGGFWKAEYGLEHMMPFCDALAREGIATWSVEYRRVGEEGGGFPGTLEDCARGAAHLAELAPRYGLDLSRTVAVGFSAGGQLALWVAAQQRVRELSSVPRGFALRLQAAISLGGTNDLRASSELRLSNGSVDRMFGGSPEQCPEHYQAACPAALAPLGVRTVVIHGVQDTNVPCEVSDRFVQAARAAGDDIEYLRLEEAGHFVLVDPLSPAFETVLSTLRRHLGL